MSALWSGWGADPFSEQVEKATSELLPAGQEDIALNLDICDQVRAKQVQPKQAMQVIKRRISHKNPNVILLALGLTDICIKNGGDHFLQEVASREFMDNLVSVLKNPSGVNHDVKSKALGLIQSWAQIAEAKPTQMGYINEVYRTLKRERFDFPPRDPHAAASAALVETMTAPEWVDGEVCMRCRTTFTTFTRKHHCRNCGNVFCQQCSSHVMSLPWFGIGQDVRVCDACHTRKAPPKNAAKLSRSKSVSSSSTSSSPSYIPAGRGGAAAHQRSLTLGGKPRKGGSSSSKEDADLALAIKLSLESAGGQGGASASGSAPYQAPSQPGTGASRATRQADGRMLEGTDADDDPDLAAAIAASLRDWAPPQPSAPDGLAGPQPGEYGRERHGLSAAQVVAPAGRENLNLPPSLELPPQDVDSLLTFAQTVQAQEVYNRHHGISGAPPHQQAQALFEKASAARPKVARSLEEGRRRHGVLVSMHDKLTEAVRLYDHLLDAQMSRPAAYGSHVPAGYPAQVHSGYYEQDPRLAPQSGPGVGVQQPRSSSGIYPSVLPSHPASVSRHETSYHPNHPNHAAFAPDPSLYSHTPYYPNVHHAPSQSGPAMSATPQPPPQHYPTDAYSYGADAVKAGNGGVREHASTSPENVHAAAHYHPQHPQYGGDDAYAQHAGGTYNALPAAVGPSQPYPQYELASSGQGQSRAYPHDGYAHAGDGTASAHGYYLGSQSQTPQPGAFGQTATGRAAEQQLAPTQPSHIGLDPLPSQAQPPNTAHVHVNGYSTTTDPVSLQRPRSTDTLASSSTGWNNVPIEQVSPGQAGGPAVLNSNAVEQRTAAQAGERSDVGSPTAVKSGTVPFQGQHAGQSNTSYLPIFPVAPHPDSGLGPSTSQTELVSPASANTNGRSSAGMWQQSSNSPNSAAHGAQAVGESPLIEF